MKFGLFLKENNVLLDELMLALNHSRTLVGNNDVSYLFVVPIEKSRSISYS